MREPILFWDTEMDHPIILDESGEFYFYGEDSVAIRLGAEGGQYWTKLNKMQDRTPLNGWEKYEILNPETGEWEPWDGCDDRLIEKVHKQANDPDWRDRL